MRQSGTSWLCPSVLDRERYLETSTWLIRARLLAVGALAVLVVLSRTPLLIGGPPLVAAAAGYVVSDAFGSRRPRPEYWGFAAWSLSIVSLALVIAQTGGAESLFVCWMLISTPGLLARYSVRGIVLGTLLSFACLLSACLTGTRGDADAAELLSPLLLLASVTALCWAMMRSETAQRAGAIVDPLTGMFNRKGLAQRLEALQHQAALTRSSVAAIMCDLDRFKEVNDTYGHETGDIVLREAAYSLRSSLRPFDTAFRFGGEEFLVLLAATDIDEAEAIAERIRRKVESARPGGLPVTISVGVAYAEGLRVSSADLVARADAALYRSKADGRNRVTVSAVPALEVDRAPGRTRSLAETKGADLVISGNAMGPSPR